MTWVRLVTTLGTDHIPSELIPPRFTLPTLFSPPVTALLNLGFPLTCTQPLPMQPMIIVVKTKMEDSLVQVGKARGLTIVPDDTPAVPHPPSQPPPPQVTRMTHPQVEWAPSSHVRTTQTVEYYIFLDKAWACPWDMTEDCIPPGSAANPGILLKLALSFTPFEFPFNMTTQMYGDFNVKDGLPLPLLRYSVSKVVGLP